MNEELESRRKKISKIQKNIFTKILPNIYRAKYLSYIEEKKIMHRSLDKKIQNEEWNLRKPLIFERHKISIMNFEGQKNLIFEQIFMIFFAKPKILGQIIL